VPGFGRPARLSLRFTVSDFKSTVFAFTEAYGTRNPEPNPLMSATDFNVGYLADLARIKLTPDEIEKFQSQLSHVLEHVERLNQVDVSNVEPMAHSFPIYNVFRKDEVGASLDREVALSNAPRQAHGLFIVTKVVE
jgi:aspartyl-tRNA(Asn)/glutamyl-tRNA(Gln) amidotransferase subunit C